VPLNAATIVSSGSETLAYLMLFAAKLMGIIFLHSRMGKYMALAAYLILIDFLRVPNLPI
jgi:hypothetical protein